MKPIMLFWILLSVGLTASAQLVFKSAMMKEATQRTLGADGLFGIVRLLLTDYQVILGMMMYGGAAALWLYVLGHVDLSKAYPFVGLGFIITAVGSAWLLQETLNSSRIAGTALVCIGVYLVSKS